MATTNISQLVIKIAERCNLRCSYCYLYQHGDTTFRDRPKFLPEATFEQLLARINEYLDGLPGAQMTLIFHGGEPTLVGAHRAARLAERAHDVLGERLGGIAMQTNGTLLDDGWLEVIRAQGIQVGVSLDGPANVHDANRVDFRGRGSHAAAVRGLALLRSGGLSPSLLCVVNPLADGAGVYRHFRDLGVERFDFLLPDVTHDTRDSFFPGLPQLSVGRYLADVFDAWFTEDDDRVKVRLLWGFLAAILGGAHETDQFGNGLSAYVVVETDGSLQPNDVLRICRDGMTASPVNVFTHSFDELVGSDPLLKQLYETGVPLCEACRTCPEVEVCGGGYAPHRYSRENGFDNPSVWCADILFLIGHIRRRLGEAAR